MTDHHGNDGRSSGLSSLRMRPQQGGSLLTAWKQHWELHINIKINRHKTDDADISTGMKTLQWAGPAMEKTTQKFTMTDIKEETDRLYHDLDVCKIPANLWLAFTGYRQWAISGQLTFGNTFLLCSNSFSVISRWSLQDELLDNIVLYCIVRQEIKKQKKCKRYIFATLAMSVYIG